MLPFILPIFVPFKKTFKKKFCDCHTRDEENPLFNIFLKKERKLLERNDTKQYETMRYVFEQNNVRARSCYGHLCIYLGPLAFSFQFTVVLMVLYVLAFE